MKTFIITVVLFATFSTTFAQHADQNLELALKLKKTEEIRQVVNEYIARNPANVNAIYMQAVTEEDGQKALSLYGDLVTRYASTPQASEAMYRIGLYYMARGLYMTARKHFQLVSERPMDDIINERVTYLAATCLCASEQEDACKRELTDFLRVFPRSEMRDLVSLDLSDLGGSTPAVVQTSSQGEYTLQVGAFTTANYALNLRHDLERLGYSAEIIKQSIQGKEVFVVIVGSFPTNEAAEAAGETLKEKHGKPYRVIRK